VAENVLAGYARAVEKCIAKVEKISKECRLSNQKYSDPSFKLLNFGYCLRPLSTYVPPEKTSPREDEPDRLDPPKLTLLVDDREPINLSQFVAPQAEDSNEAEEDLPGRVPQSVKRVKQIFDEPNFYVDGATADDVRQGDAGDCWFISALSALCSMEAKELGNLVERVCVKRDEAVGVYGFVFFRDGEWRSEVVDDTLYLTATDYSKLSYSQEMDYLLKYIKESDRAEQYRKIVQSNSDALFYAKSAHKYETWVPLIEKAFAKAHGDYTAIEDGMVG
jgi:Calpain family cysteine protease